MYQRSNLFFVQQNSSGSLRGAGGESSSEVFDRPLWTGLSREPLSQNPPPPPPSFWGLKRPPPPPRAH